MSEKVMVFVGTRKGGFIFCSDPNRAHWEMQGVHFESWNMMHMRLDQRDQRLHAAVDHFIYGPTTHYSDDYGHTWTQARQTPAFPRPSKLGRPFATPEEAFGAGNEGGPDQSRKEEVLRVWNIQPAGPSEPGKLYAGVQPAALFVSTDRGETWTLNDGLYDHPHRPTWYPGAGGLCLHTILPDPSNPQRIYIAISSAGCYRSDDGGQTWTPRNKNVRADFAPDPFPEYGQCVHKMALHPAQPNVIYQQNHCGMYRSDNGGDDWIDIGEGRLPSRFGFPIAVHPHDPRTIYIAPEKSDEYRLSLDGRFSVWRSRDAGQSWERLTRGLPEQAHLVVLREAMATDSLDKAGIYVGASTGQLFYSRDAGDTWQLLADYLPPILSVEAAVVA